ncbi:MAG: hypothetical protein ABI220_04085 [Candidatus Saccharimonadales bacterium]
MELADTTVKQNYVKQIKALEASIEEATSGEVNQELLGEAQTRLDALAKRYQENEKIGSALYKLYELQAVVHYFNENDNEALDFIDHAIEVRGASYARAEKLKKLLQDQSYSQVSSSPTSKPTISESDQSVIHTRQVVVNAGLWPFAFGLVFIFVALGILAIGAAAIPFSIVILVVSIYLVYAGWKLDKVSGDDNFIKKLLTINIVISIITVWALLPIFMLVSSVIARKRIKKYEGNFHKEVKKYDAIMKRTYSYQNENSVFFYRSPVAIAILCIITFNFYAVYWVYKHWFFIRKSTKEKLHPVWNGIFEVFTIYPLMKRIRGGAQQHGYKKFKRAGWAATGFIILLYVSNGVWRSTTSTGSEVAVVVVVSLIATSCFVAIMVVVQKAANAHNMAVRGKDYKFKKVFVGEVIMTIVGVIIALAVLSASISSIGKVSVGSLSPETKSAYQEEESLRSEYNKCSTDIESRRSSVDTSNNYEVNSFNDDLQQCNNTRDQLNQAVDKYNRLAGLE